MTAQAPAISFRPLPPFRSTLSASPKGERASLVDILDLAPLPGKGPLSATDKKFVFLLTAMGEPAGVIAEKLGLSEELVGDLCKSKSGVDQIVRMQTALFPNPAERIKRCAHMAIDASVKLLLGGKTEAVVAKVAGDLLDRSQGKAVQITENRNFNVDITDMAAADKALEAQMERLARLESVQAKLLAAKNVTPGGR